MKALMPVLLVLALAGGLASAQDHMAGQKAPDFKLKDLFGKEHSLSQFKDKVVVLEWTNKDCPVVKRHYEPRTMQKLAEMWEAKGVVWLSIDSTHSAEAGALKEWKEEQKVGYPILLDPSGDVGRAYKAKTTPHMFIVKDGMIVYDGAIDDGRRGNPTKNYVTQALKEVLSGKEVSERQTRPYGCTVKYGKKKEASGDAAATEWHESYQKALAASEKTGKPILADFTGSDWCGWCIKLKKEVFDTPHFKKWAAENVVLLELDFPKKKEQSDEIKKQNKELLQKFGVRGFPTIIFMNAKGERIGQSGYKKGGAEAWCEDASRILKNEM